MLGSCCVFGACGSKFSASEGAGGVSDLPGQTGGSSSGAAARAGAESGHRGEESAGDAGTDSGGAAAGVTGDSGGGGTGGGPIAHGGSSGNTGMAGAIDQDQPVIPQLGLALWLRADLGVQQASGLVQSWLDQSGNQRNAVPTSPAVRPLYNAKGLNDLPTLEFDGVADFLKLPAGFGDFSHGLAGFMVVRPTDSNCASVLELSNGSETQDIALGMWQNSWTYEVEDPYLKSGSDVDLRAPSLYAVNHQPTMGTSSATADLRLNRNLQQTLQMPLPQVIARQNNFVGRTLYSSCNYFKGSVSEIILYDRVVTAIEVKSIESYLQQHWALGLVAMP
ncbi:MAG: hypothetical protein ABIQ16_15850 [Polyangiaceae bacterium]